MRVSSSSCCFRFCSLDWWHGGEVEGSTFPVIDIRLPSTELSSSDPSANSERIKSVSTRYLQQTEMKLKKIDLNLKCMLISKYFLRSRKIIRSSLFVYCSQTLGCIYVFSSLNCTSMYRCCLVWMIQGKSQWLRSSKTFPKSVVFFHVQNYRNVHFFDQFLFNFYPVKISWHTSDWCVSS